MRVLFTSLRNTSHFLPLVPFIQACRQQGHEVAVAAPVDLAERVATTGAAFIPLGHPGDAGLGPIWKRMRDASREESKRIAIQELFAGTLAGAALPSLLEAVSRWRPAIVVRESQEYAAVVAAAKAGIPHGRVAISAPGGELDLLPLAAPAVDAHGQAAGLPADPVGERLRREPILTLFPEALDIVRPDLATVHRFRATRRPAPPLPNWWPSLDGPFVYVTLGTVIGAMDQMRSAFGPALDAVRDLPVRALLTTGADLPMEALGEVPANVHVEPFVPQDDVLPHASAVLCHGGSGTILGTLAAGVPMVVAPMFADQSFNAERVVAAGAGLTMPLREAAADDLRAALGRLLDEGAFRDAARRVAAEMEALPLVDSAPATLEALARS
jgi:UDP:flavonoid glycosyltransferase YjiC (YdhE family)